jgi:hypothetical protein
LPAKKVPAGQKIVPILKSWKNNVPEATGLKTYPFDMAFFTGFHLRAKLLSPDPAVDV